MVVDEQMFVHGNSYHEVQRYTVLALVAMLNVVMVLSAVHLGVLIGQEIWKPPKWLIPMQGPLEIFDTSCSC